MSTRSWVNFPDFPLEWTGFFQRKHVIQVLANKMQDFRNFVPHNSILNFDSEQVDLKSQVTNIKNKEVTTNPKTRSLERLGISKTLNPKP